MEQLPESVVAICLNDAGEMLILKRAPHKKYFPDKWDTIAGKLEPGESVEESIRREIAEEIGPQEIVMVKDCGRAKRVHGEKEWFASLFLFRLINPHIVLNDEHTEYKWIPVQDLSKWDCSAPLLGDLEILEKEIPAAGQPR